MFCVESSMFMVLRGLSFCVTISQVFYHPDSALAYAHRFRHVTQITLLRQKIIADLNFLVCTIAKRFWHLGKTREFVTNQVVYFCVLQKNVTYEWLMHVNFRVLNLPWFPETKNYFEENRCLSGFQPPGRRGLRFAYDAPGFVWEYFLSI